MKKARHTDAEKKAFQSLPEWFGDHTNILLEQQGFRTKELFEMFMENSPAPAWIAGVDCTLYYMNRRYRETFNLGNECLNQRPLIFPPAYLKLYEENNRKVIQENTVLETNEDGYDHQGNYRTFKVFKFPLYTKTGETLIGGWMIDLTGMLAMEKELKQSNERYLYASKATSDVIWEWNVAEKKLFVGADYKEVFGHDEPKDLEDLLRHVHPEDRALVYQNIAEAKQKRALHWQVEYRYQCASGAIKHVLNKALMVRDKEGTAIKAIGALQDVTSYRQLQAELVREQEERKREVLKAIIQGQEKERHEIGKELHDNVNQLLATAKLLLDAARMDSDNRDLCLKTSAETIDKALDEIRNLSHTLVPPSLHGKDFQESIQKLVEYIQFAGTIQATIHLPEESELDAIDSCVRLTLYRIIQEQLTNVIKHAGARNIEITLELQKESICLTISDDGVGFDLRKKRKGIGLKNISTRVEMHSGKTRILTEPGKGCRILIKIPLHK